MTLSQDMEAPEASRSSHGMVWVRWKETCHGGTFRYRGTRYSTLRIHYTAHWVQKCTYNTSRLQAVTSCCLPCPAIKKGFITSERGRRTRLKNINNAKQAAVRKVYPQNFTASVWAFWESKDLQVPWILSWHRPFNYYLGLAKSDPRQMHAWDEHRILKHFD